MQNNEDGCIRYLMKEMDPSEELEFEREMMEDENLLIEVESLRKTFQHLGKLPVLDPPKTLTDKISETATTTQKQRIDQTRKWAALMAKSVAVAAVFLMIASTGIYFYGNSNSDGIDVGNNPSSASVNGVQPWVNRNNVIRFAGTASQGANPQPLQQDVEQSFKKLKLVNDDTGFEQTTRKILLTSSSN